LAVLDKYLTITNKVIPPELCLTKRGVLGITGGNSISSKAGNRCALMIDFSSPPCVMAQASPRQVIYPMEIK
jgi:hypothetical protein